MNSKSILLGRCALVVALAASIGCDRKTPTSNQLVGEWLGRSVTNKLDGHPDETKTYSGNEYVMTFSADGSFADLDRGVHGEVISIKGSYEIKNDHTLQETIREVTGSRIASEGLTGRTGTMDFKVTRDQLTLVMQLADKGGKNIGTTESTFVRAPQ